MFSDAGHYVLEDAGEEILKELDYLLTQLYNYKN